MNRFFLLFVWATGTGGTPAGGYRTPDSIARTVSPGNVRPRPRDQTMSRGSINSVPLGLFSRPSSVAVHPPIDPPIERPELESEEIDQYGLLRASPNLMHWDVKLELFPNRVFRMDSRGYGYATFGRILGSSGSSRVYEILEYDQRWVIKYTAWCGEPYYEWSDPVLNEATFLKLLAGTGVTNDLLYYSREVELSPNLMNAPFGKLGSIRSCSSKSSRQLPLVRYIITSRVGPSIADAITTRGLVDFGTALEICMQLLDLIESIHSRNIIHGDVHPGNFAIALENPSKIIMIDLGRMELIPDTPRQTPEQNNPIACHGYTSPWESLLLPRSYRDDLYRIVLILGELIYGEGFIDSLEKICYKTRYKNDYLKSKLESHILNTSFMVADATSGRVIRESKRFFLSDILLYAVDEIGAKLSDLLTSIRSLALDQKPDYGYLRSLFNEMREILNSHSV